MSEKVRYEKEGKVAYLTIDNPPANTLSRQTFAELDEYVDRVNADPDVVLAVVTGAGDRFFSAGSDIKEMPEYEEPIRVQFQRRAHGTQWKIERGPKLFLAAINGAAGGGGCELALTCDLVVAAERAVFTLPEPRIGIIPGFGGIQRLIRRVPLACAYDLLVSRDIISAQRALSMGLVSRVFPNESFEEDVRQFAQRIAEGAPISLRLIKRLVVEGLEMRIADALSMELDACPELWATADKEEGIRSFIEKRPPVFQNR
ncbi:MAG: enoyl-CoA hydratase/isomerase family protein [Chloroflexota bacterium]|nr:MAG: enoyl-CoA hydratase/isomerase family protein [Chloroflexota bacterium]